ncbi:hypothetical protein MPSEU_000799400 [Mayamaea pseudoterrestris]|nr:hypothetical protein MPSEU_000799400 [Mayamaea pseudoterrestris]
MTAPDNEDESGFMTPEMLLADLQQPDQEEDADQIEVQTDDTHSNGSPAPQPLQDFSHIQNERTSFTADSPYFSSFCEKEIQSLTVLSDALKEISTRTKTYVQNGVNMVEATRRLAASCRLKRELSSEADMEDRENEETAFQLRKQAVGEEMVTLLAMLGSVLEETAFAQENMCRSLELTLSETLDAFIESETKMTSILKHQADETTEAAEQVYLKYLTGKAVTKPYSSANNSGNDLDHGASSSNGTAKTRVGNSLRNWSKKAGLSTEITGPRRTASNGSRNNVEGADAELSSELQAAIAKAAYAANLRSTLEQIRLANATAELKRFQLMKQLLSVKHRKRFELGESIVACFHGMNAYYHQCDDLVSGVIPRLNRLQVAQNQLRESFHKVTSPSWRERELTLIDTTNRIKDDYITSVRVMDRVSDGDIVAVKENQDLDAKTVEEEVDFWNLFKMLSSNSRFQRECMPGIIIEGWLYKKSSAMISLNPWSRRWFGMDKDSIFYYRHDSEIRKGSSDVAKYYERVKMCDVVLCTIRELPSDRNGSRYCFQLVSPSEKPLTLQAKSETDYRMWVDGIRSNIEKQLVSGDPLKADLNKNIGLKAKRPSDSNLDAAAYAESFSELPLDVNDDADNVVSTPVGNKRSSLTSFVCKANPVVREIMEMNPICADCGMADPDWASLNLGVLVCIECSAVHRSLGVHVSKIRSLMLDSLNEGEERLVLSLGNDKVNPIWEEGMKQQEGWKKPTELVDRKTREDWIKSKYMWKGFLDFTGTEELSEDERIEKYSRDLFEAARNGDVCGAVYALSHGGSVDWINKNDGGKTPLHASVLVRKVEGQPWLAIETTELLLQNGARMDVLDASSHGLLDCALLGNAELAMVEFLTTKLA